MSVGVVWKERNRWEAQGRLWAWLEIAKLSGWRHLVVAVDHRERVYIGLQFDAVTYREGMEDVSPPWPYYRRAPMTFDELLEDPLHWRELYVDEGVIAFRYWGGRMPDCYVRSKGGPCCPCQ